MKNFKYFIACTLIILISLDLVGQVERKIDIKSGVKYNTSMGYFEFASDKDFNDYLLEILSQTKNIKGEKKEEFYSALSKKYKHSSVRKLIKEKVNNQLNSGIWTPDNDLDNYFIQSDVLRFILSKLGEVVVANKYILFVDKCELITCQSSDKLIILKLRENIRDVFDSNKSKLNSISKSMNYCNQNSRNNKNGKVITDEDCCDKSDRNKFKYLEYANGTRRIKAVFWQTNLSVIPYREVGAKTVNYKKNRDGKWELEKADDISVEYGGTLYVEDEYGTDCSVSQEFGPPANRKKNENEAEDSYSWWTFSDIWSKQCSIVSYHYVSDNGGHATIKLHLTIDCGECEDYTEIGDNNPTYIPTVQLNKKHGDFNNDHKTDLLYFGDNSTAVAVNKGNYFAISEWQIAKRGIFDFWTVGDFNGDGKDDVLNAYGTEGVKVFLSNGNSFLPCNTIWTGYGVEAEQFWTVGDFSGDGLDDILRTKAGIGVEVLTSTGSSFNAPVKWTGSGFGNEGFWTVGDFDGNNKDDILRTYPGPVIQVLLSNGTSFQDPITWSSYNTYSPLEKSWRVGDFNGDGRDDLLRTKSTSNPPQVEVLLSKLIGVTNVFEASILWAKLGDPHEQQSELLGSHNSTFPGSTNTAIPIVTTGDFNGDNTTDILYFDKVFKMIRISNKSNFEKAIKW